MTLTHSEFETEKVRLARYLVSRVTGWAAGRLEDVCTHNPPRDRYYVGSLRPTGNAANARQRLPDEVLRKIAPVAFGLDVRLVATEQPFELRVTLQWACYFRLMPLREQQRAHQGAGVVVGSGRLFPRYRKLSCNVSAPIVVAKATSGSWIVDTAPLVAAANAEVARAQRESLGNPERLRWQGNQETAIPPAALADDSAYAAFCAGLPELAPPPWSWELSATAREGESAADLVLELLATNRSSIDRDDWQYEGFFFDVALRVDAQKGRLAKFDLDLIPRGFRYDRSMWGRGFNCGVTHETSHETDVLTTTSAPIFEQSRFVTSTDPPARFDILESHPIETLESISSAMQAYFADWDRYEAEYRRTNSSWDALYAEEYAQDRTDFEKELVRFNRGLDLVRSDPDVQLAFRLTNRAFSGNPQKPSWRLFQIVFLVSQIPGIAALKTEDPTDLDDRRFVDIVYFPTGGGKTEAYLAVIVFQLFFDRLRGKSAGVSVWTRFPLRLLTLQQTQRAADVVGSAELIRKHHSDSRLSGGIVDGFSIGYLAGADATPNDLKPPAPGAPPDHNWSIATDPEARQRWKKVVRCPACRTLSITVDFDAQSVRLIHRCGEPNCKFPSGELPVYVVDNDLFRYLPSVIVGTIDKLASIGNQRKMALLLGRVTGKCRVHGYCCNGCCQSNCKDPLLIASGTPPGLSGPSLFVQDELHLLKEGLGTFDAHYETFLQELLRDFGELHPLKIVASSATIEAFDRQANHLYGRPARVFPGLGPKLGESFYATTRDFPQRIYVGILPHNKTMHNAMLELLETYQREICALSQSTAGMDNPFGGVSLPGSPEWQRLVDLYKTSLCYFSANRELSSQRTDLESDTSPRLEGDGVEPFRIEQLSGSTSTDVITSTLDRLEHGDRESQRAPNLILATSMISHGVDVDRLNAMFFFGMPRQNAEYIQASSRVGRTHCGIVFACMKPARERDQSHFSYFGKYHEFLGRLVEPVAINRWSKFSLQKTLPGLFMAVLLQDRANRSGVASPGLYSRIEFVRKQISQGSLRVEDFVDILERAYLVKDGTDARSAEIRDEIRRRIAQFRDQIVSSGATAQWVSQALMPTPMRSLREVDEQVTIELDSNGSIWADLAPTWGD